MKLAFQAARKYPKECQRARLDIDQRVRNAVAEWKSAERQIVVALQIDYPNPNKFTSAFRAEYGVLPMKYLKKKTQESLNE